MEPLNIMIVDDSALTIKQLKQAIGELGHKVVYAAKTGNEAVENYGHYNPDIVTMDITMPDMDGLAATKAILQIYPDAKIVMVTSHRQEHTVLDAIRAGAKGYIIKPFKADKLQEAFANLIARYGLK